MTDEAEYDAIEGQVYVDRALAGLDKYRKSVEQLVKEWDKSMKTRILPEVGKQYISRKDGVVVEVVDVRHGRHGVETVVDFVKADKRAPLYFYDLDSFWETYKVMEEEDGP